MALRANSFEGGSDETAITTANSGGDSGDAFDSVTSGASTVVYDTARAAHGSVSARYDIVSSTVFATWLEDAFTTAFFRTYFWAAASPSSAQTILRLRDGTTLVGRVQLNTSGQVAITNAAGAIQTVGSTVITDSSWWRVEVGYVAGTTTGSVEVRIFAGDSTEATETITASATDFGAQATEISWGMSFAPTTTYVYWLDDVAYDTADWIGPEAGGATQIIRPTATTNAGNWAAVGAATLHEAVDEETASFTDHIVSDDDPNSSPVVLRLAPLVEPAGTVNDDDVIVHAQYDKEGGATTNLVIELRQGYTNEGSPGTLIATTTDSGVTDAAEDGVISLTAVEYGNITFSGGQASDLDVRIVADLT
jgi:hypothetical protein